MKEVERLRTTLLNSYTMIKKTTGRANSLVKVMHIKDVFSKLYVNAMGMRNAVASNISRIIAMKNTDVYQKDNDTKYSITQLESQLHDIASVLLNITIIGKEKRKVCVYYDVNSGLCKYIKLDVQVPTLTSVKDGDSLKIIVALHPEICAVCPFWEKRSS